MTGNFLKNTIEAIPLRVCDYCHNPPTFHGIRFNKCIVRLSFLIIVALSTQSLYVCIITNCTVSPDTNFRQGHHKSSTLYEIYSQFSGKIAIYLIFTFFLKGANNDSDVVALILNILMPCWIFYTFSSIINK